MLKLDADDMILSRRLYTRAIDGIVADESESQTRWFLTDQVGTVRDLVDNSGNLLNHYRYDSFGQLLHQSNPLVSNDLLFNGREFSAALGLGYFRTRYYAPEQGRFIAHDLLAPFGYRFGGNNPNLFTDPTGLVDAGEAQIISALIGASAVAFATFWAFTGVVVAGGVAILVGGMTAGAQVAGSTIEAFGAVVAALIGALANSDGDDDSGGDPGGDTGG